MIEYCSWIISTYLYMALNMTPNIDWYRVGQYPIYVDMATHAPKLRQVFRFGSSLQELYFGNGGVGGWGRV